MNAVSDSLLWPFALHTHTHTHARTHTLALYLSHAHTQTHTGRSGKNKVSRIPGKLFIPAVGQLCLNWSVDISTAAVQQRYIHRYYCRTIRRGARGEAHVQAPLTETSAHQYRCIQLLWACLTALLKRWQGCFLWFTTLNQWTEPQTGWPELKCISLSAIYPNSPCPTIQDYLTEISCHLNTSCAEWTEKHKQESKNTCSTSKLLSGPTYAGRTPGDMGLVCTNKYTFT